MRISLSFTIFFMLCNAVFASTVNNGISKSNQIYNSFKFHEICRIRIHNEKNGDISVLSKNGSAKIVGKVLFPADSVKSTGYRASKWSNISSIAATAVNAIHIKTDYNSINNRGVIFSLYPKNFKYLGKNKNSSVILTNIEGGKSIFGNWESPLVGNPVFIIKEEKASPLPKGYIPKEGDLIEIRVKFPDNYPKEIVFENRFGGRITAKDQSNKERVIGTVYSPVQGIGRFLGTQFVPAGRIRANHSGVIDISTSPKGKFGGFQIIPSTHSHSSEMWRAILKTQWMVIGPVDARESSLENIAPFFSSYIKPVYSDDDLDQENWLERIKRRYLVMIKKNNGKWDTMPNIYYSLKEPLPSSADTVFKNITHIKIIFPVLSKNTFN